MKDETMQTGGRMTLAEARATIATEGAPALAARLGRRAAGNPLNAIIAQDYNLPCDGSGPLAGVPIGVKDNIDVLPFATTGGSPAMAGYYPQADAPIVARLRDAGAWFPAKLNLHEFAFGITSDNAAYGPVLNPYDAGRTAGGSSGGSGAAVAAGLVPVALGTDTGASVRIPAAYCGLAGLRPTTGRYPVGGVLPISWSRDTPGVLANCVADIAELDAIIMPSDMPEPARPMGRIRLGLCADALPGFVPALEERFRTVLEALQQAGVIELIVLPPLGYRQVQEAWDVASSVVEAHAFWKQFCPEVLGQSLGDFTTHIGSPDVAAIFAEMPDVSEAKADTYRKYLRHGRPMLQARLGALFASYGIDAVVAPTSPVHPPLRSEYQQMTVSGETRPTLPVAAQNVSIATMAGAPSLTLPAGLDACGLPVGVLLDGPIGTDRRLLAIGARIEAALA